MQLIWNDLPHLQRSIIHDNVKDYSAHRVKIEEAYDCLERFLCENKFVAGPNVRVKVYLLVKQEFQT